MKINLYCLLFLPRVLEELELIKALCNFEGIEYELRDQNHKEFKQNYMGCSIIIACTHNGTNYTIRGFWNFAAFLEKNGLIRI